MASSKADRLAVAASWALGERNVSGAGIFSEYTIISPQSDLELTSPFSPIV
jgi:hypothetical protein